MPGAEKRACGLGVGLWSITGRPLNLAAAEAYCDCAKIMKKLKIFCLNGVCVCACVSRVSVVMMRTT